MNEAELIPSLTKYTEQMTKRGMTVSKAEAAKLLAEVAVRQDFSDHQRKVWSGRIRGLCQAEGLFDNSVIHPNWHLNGAESGRWTSDKPSVQNLSPEIKRLFVAPEHRQVASVDVDQMELYVAAVLADQRNLIEAYERGDDLHQTTADHLALDRKTAKVFNLANMYGQTEVGIAARLGISANRAGELLRAFWRAYSRLAQHKEWVFETAVITGSVETQILGHRRVIAKNQEAYHIRNSAYSTVVSGTSSDLMKLAFLKAMRFGLDIRAVVHDEFVAYVQTPAEAQALGECLRTAHRKYLLRVKTKVGQSWALAA